MARDSSRRSFLVRAIAAVCASSRGAFAWEQMPERAKTLDVHIHLLGVGDAGSGCRISTVVSASPVFRLLAERLKVRKRANTIDEGYVLALAEHLETSGLDQGVVLAQDAVYDSAGKPDWARTHFYVPNDYVFQAAECFPRRIIPCVSINPLRRDAIDELERCAMKGAKALKIHPPTQGVDLLDTRHIPFFRRCAELKTVLMVHTGHEHSAPVISAELSNPRRLALALEEGCTVVACHSGAGWPTDSFDMLPDFLAMLRKYENVWGDTSVLGTALRVRDMLRLLADSEAKGRLLHGSDFPFPSAPLAFAGTIGAAEAIKVQSVGNLIERDFLLKDALGIGQESAERAYRLIYQHDA